MTTDPDRERTKDIPALSTGTEVYKDFKVVFNGGVESTSSVKSFKWLSKVDTSAIEQTSIKDTVKSLKTNINTDIDSTVKTITETKQQLKQSVNELKNLFKLQSTPAANESSTATEEVKTEETNTGSESTATEQND